MSNNAQYEFDDVGIVAIAGVDAPTVVTVEEIDEQLWPFYERVSVPRGLLNRLAGLKQVRHWDEGFSFTDAAAAAGRKALAESGIDPADVGLLIDTSVCKLHLEPAAAVTVHNLLGLDEACINLDVSNACLGFFNAVHLAGHLIEAGAIDYALIVDGEGTNDYLANAVKRLNERGVLEDFGPEFGGLTLGSAASAAVLGKVSTNPGSHRIKNGQFRTASQHIDLCYGTIDHGMITDGKGMLQAAVELAKDTRSGGKTAHWPDMDMFFLHQVSKVHTGAMLDVLDLDAERAPWTFPEYGNIGPATIPFSIARHSNLLSQGDDVLCIAMGSGMNSGTLEIVW